MNAACPKCGVPFTLGPEHMGSQFACPKCQSVLVARQDGLHLVNAPQAPAAAPARAAPAGGGATMYTAAAGGESAAAATPRSRRGAVMGEAALSYAKSNVMTLLFWAGSALAVIFLFLPLIDRVKVMRLQAKMDAEEQSIRRVEQEVARRTDASSSEKDAIKKRREEWDKTGRTEMSRDVEDAGVSQRTNAYWYLWGMMFAFLMLAISSIGWLDPQQVKGRRVVGAIIICSILLLIFISFIIPSMSL